MATKNKLHGYSADVDEAIDATRQKLENLRSRGTQQRNERELQLRRSQEGHGQALERLKNRLFNLERESLHLITAELKQVYGASSRSSEHYTAGSNMLPPMYVLKQQAQLGSQMHMTFSVYERQIELIVRQEQRIVSYLREQLCKELSENRQQEQEKLRDVSMVASNNQAFYDVCQERVDDQEIELKKLRTTANDYDIAQGDSVERTSWTLEAQGIEQPGIKSLAHGWKSFVRLKPKKAGSALGGSGQLSILARRRT